MTIFNATISLFGLLRNSQRPLDEKHAHNATQYLPNRAPYCGKVPPSKFINNFVLIIKHGTYSNRMVSTCDVGESEACFQSNSHRCNKKSRHIISHQLINADIYVQHGILNIEFTETELAVKKRKRKDLRHQCIQRADFFLRTSLIIFRILLFFGIAVKCRMQGLDYRRGLFCSCGRG